MKKSLFQEMLFTTLKGKVDALRGDPSEESRYTVHYLTIADPLLDKFVFGMVIDAKEVEKEGKIVIKTAVDSGYQKCQLIVDIITENVDSEDFDKDVFDHNIEKLEDAMKTLNKLKEFKIKPSEAEAYLETKVRAAGPSESETEIILVEMKNWLDKNFKEYENALGLELCCASVAQSLEVRPEIDVILRRLNYDLYKKTKEMIERGENRCEVRPDSGERNGESDKPDVHTEASESEEADVQSTNPEDNGDTRQTK